MNRRLSLLVPFAIVASIGHAQSTAAAPRRASDRLALARELQNRGDLRGAEQEFQKSIAAIKKPRSLEAAKTLAAAGVFYQDIAKFAQAEQCLRKSLQISSERAGRDDLGLAPLIANLGWLYFETGRMPEAKALNLASWVARVNAADPDSKYLSLLQQSLAGLYVLEGRFVEGEEAFYRAFDYLPNNGDHSVEMAMAFNNFGLVCMRGGRYYQAYTYLENALTLTLEFFRPTDLSVAIVKENLAEAYTYAGDDVEARRLFEESVAVFEQRCGPNCLRTAEALARYATALRYLGRGEEAERLDTRARKIRRAADGIVGVSVDVKELDPKR